MILIRLSIAIVLMALFAPNAFAQANRNGDDQPGLIANPTTSSSIRNGRGRWCSTAPPSRRARSSSHSNERYLYVVQPGGRALRYGIGVGRDGFQLAGPGQDHAKTEWPDWTPPPEMIERQPYLPRLMAGGPGNPLGARALYLGTTVYRIHGTNQPQTIGNAVSSGCFRLANRDMSDLYERMPVGTKVVIRQRPEV